MNNISKIISDEKIKKIVLLIALLFALISVFQGCKNAMTKPGSFDFQYDAEKYIALRLDPYLETLQPTNLQEKLGLYNIYGDIEANQFPSLLLLLLPYTVFQPKIANILWLICNLAMTGWILNYIYRRICVRKIDREAYIIICCMFLFSCPWRNHIGVGQHTIFSLFFYLLSLEMTQNNHRHLSGLLLACSYFKYTLTVPLALYYVYDKKYKEVIISIIPHIFGTIAVSIWLNVPVSYLIISPLKIATRFSSIGSINISSIVPMGEFSLIISLLLCIMMLVVSAFGRKCFTDWEFLSLLVMFSLIIVYHRTYDAFILIIPFMVVLMEYMEYKSKVMLALVSLSTCVVCLFYLDRIMVLLPQDIYNCYMKILAILFYLTYVVCWITFSKTKKLTR